MEFEDTDPEYREVSNKEIAEAVEGGNPLKVAALLMVNDVVDEAKERRLWKPREKEFRETGWYLTLHENQRPETAVCLWSCWLGDQFYLGYPKGTDKRKIKGLVERTLKAEYQGQNWDCSDIFKSQVAPNVKIYMADDWSYHHGVDVIQDKSFRKIDFGYHLSGTLSTNPFNDTTKEEVQGLRDNFFDLLTELVLQLGKPNRLTVNYQLMHTMPHDLEREDYKDIVWLKGDSGIRNGWGSELVYAKKPGEEIMLQSANSIVPWVTTRQIEIPRSMINKDDMIEQIQLTLRS